MPLRNPFAPPAAGTGIAYLALVEARRDRTEGNWISYLGIEAARSDARPGGSGCSRPVGRATPGGGAARWVSATLKVPIGHRVRRIEHLACGGLDGDWGPSIACR